MLARLATRGLPRLRPLSLATPASTRLMGSMKMPLTETPDTKGPLSRKVLQQDEHLFPDHVLTEKYIEGESGAWGTHNGGGDGLPFKRDEDLWATGHDELLAERSELFWDDGTAEPEWFIDRGSAGGMNLGSPHILSNQRAAGELFGVLFGILIFVGGPAYLIGDKFKPAAPRADFGFPQDMRPQFGLDGFTAGEDAEEDEE